MKFKINVGISYQSPGKPLEYYPPGATADLTDWPTDDLDRLQREGTIELTEIAAPPDVSLTAPAVSASLRQSKATRTQAADQPAPDSEEQQA